MKLQFGLPLILYAVTAVCIFFAAMATFKNQWAVGWIDATPYSILAAGVYRWWPRNWD